MFCSTGCTENDNVTPVEMEFDFLLSGVHGYSCPQCGCAALEPDPALLVV